jgi:hypothetical protein
MKLAALYTLWNGLELIEKSIQQIYNECDEIILCWQHRSNKGELSSEIIPFLDRFKDNPKIHIIEFKPDLNRSTKQNERSKLQLRIDYAKKLGCTHFFSSACDHYYSTNEFMNAKKTIIEHGYETTFTKMATYYKHPTWKLEPLESYYMPFICKLYDSTTVVSQQNYHCRVDPSIQIQPCLNPHIFNEDEILMHHFSMIRKDIENKFRNAAASIRWKPQQIETFIKEYENAKPGDEITYFQKRKLIECDNLFNI